MNTTIIGKYEQVDTPCNEALFAPFGIEMYDAFNLKDFPSSMTVPTGFDAMVRMIYNKFGQSVVISVDDNKLPKIALRSDKQDVALAFSGGLDSCYQALMLREAGYTVHLCHFRGMNTYEGNTALRSGITFTEKTGMDFIEIDFHKVPNRQYWGDNAVKNQMIYSFLIDLCIERGWNKIGSGDDMKYNLSTATCGATITDTREVIEGFIAGFKGYITNLIFLPIENNNGNKMDRIKVLDKYRLLDNYYSCVGAGRFNKYNHDKAAAKFGVSLLANNCGCFCQKCAHHNLLLHYGGIRQYPEDFLDACWNRLWNTKMPHHRNMFLPSVPKDERIRNLFSL